MLMKQPMLGGHHEDHTGHHALRGPIDYGPSHLQSLSSTTAYCHFANALSLSMCSQMEMIPEPDPDDEGTKISTVKVQGNDISHKLQISRVSKNDEGLYECRVTRANYGEIVEYKAQAWLKVNATVRPRRPLPPAKKSSPLHLTDKKPRKSTSPQSQDNMSSDQRVASTSTSHTSSNTAKHNPGSGKNSVKTYLVGT
ncbi:hypothetical protein AMECASPLE_011402 [Ameca splendens]|uniref:V-set and transmembrane domain-containing protein 2A n=1 Tax=Ameca splendens TaxID=208324 RepID=A0ABV0ZAC5_9TELE